MKARPAGGREFTGRHMFVAVVAFFFVIIAVNLLMAGLATRSWSGLVVKNSYVASQSFNEAVAAKRRQDQLGWRGKFAANGTEIGYRLTSRSGEPVVASMIQLTFRRPAYEAEDHIVTLRKGQDGTFSVRHRLADGIWVVEVLADTDADKAWRESFRVSITHGRLLQ